LYRFASLCITLYRIAIALRIASLCVALYCFASRRIALYRIAFASSYRMALHCIARIAPLYITSRRIASHRIASHRIASHRICFITLHRFASLYIALHRIALLCIASLIASLCLLSHRIALRLALLFAALSSTYALWRTGLTFSSSGSSAKFTEAKLYTSYCWLLQWTTASPLHNTLLFGCTLLAPPLSKSTLPCFHANL
jgi:hypothetical protein